MPDLIKLSNAALEWTETPPPVQKEIDQADIVISPGGKVIKDRYGCPGRNATQTELSSARIVG